MTEQKISFHRESLPPNLPEADYERNMAILRVAINEFRSLHVTEDSATNTEITHKAGDNRIISPQSGVLFVFNKKYDEYHPVYEVVVDHESLISNRVIACNGNDRRQLQSGSVADVGNIAKLMSFIGSVNTSTILSQSGRKS